MFEKDCDQISEDHKLLFGMLLIMIVSLYEPKLQEACCLALETLAVADNLECLFKIVIKEKSYIRLSLIFVGMYDIIDS